ncbi:MAG: CBS domain-containing protein [Magnetococcales bacterium]|nr:CBS domain-containing protein [Magnetococcales bacterium]
MLVSDIMATHIRTAKADDTIRSVAAVICTNNISGLPVVDEQNRLIGLVSEKDILNKLLPSFSDFLDDPVRSRDFVTMETAYDGVLSMTVQTLMTQKVLSVAPSDPLLQAASRMTINKFRRMPVVDSDGILVGIITLGDIHKAFFKKTLAK